MKSEENFERMTIHQVLNSELYLERLRYNTDYVLRGDGLAASGNRLVAKYIQEKPGFPGYFEVWVMNSQFPSGEFVRVPDWPQYRRLCSGLLILIELIRLRSTGEKPRYKSQTWRYILEVLNDSRQLEDLGTLRTLQMSQQDELSIYGNESSIHLTINGCLAKFDAASFGLPVIRAFELIAKGMRLDSDWEICQEQLA